VRFRISLKDVNGSLRAPSLVEVTYVIKGNDDKPAMVKRGLATGEVLNVELLDSHVGFRATATDFAPESVIVNNMNGTWTSDNPACLISLSGDLLDLTLTIGCVMLTPVLLPTSKGSPRDNPGAAMVDKVAGPPGETFMYRGAWLNLENFTRLDDPVFGKVDAFEWDRFKHTGRPVPQGQPGRDLEVNPKDFGYLLLLEYGFPSASKGPRFLIATWVPVKPCGERPEVLVFFSPTTKPPDYPADKWPFRKNYPYATTDKGQPYVDLGINYLITGYKIIYQLLSAGRNPIILMPIQPSGNWGPFQTQGGISRAIKEVTRFLFARQLVSADKDPPARLSLKNGRASVFPGHDLYTHATIPQSMNITLSAFSAGINPVIGICKSPAPDFKLYADYIFHAPPAGFLDQWTAIWDIDGVDASGWDDLVKTFNQWLSSRNTRVLHSYHSQTTFGREENGLVPLKNLRREPPGGRLVEQGSRDDNRASWVYFANSYLTGDKQHHMQTIPEFGYMDTVGKKQVFHGFDPHHMVPAIAFGNAAQFRQVISFQRGP
jgi:hypothetical protein